MHVDWTTGGGAGAGQLTDFLSDRSDVGDSVANTVRMLAQRGQVLAISWAPQAINPEDPAYFAGTLRPDVTLQDILNGDYDDYIRVVARQTAALDTPVMMSLFGEANAHALLGYGVNGDEHRANVSDQTGAYGDPTLLDGPERMRDIFRKIIDIFRAEGADNVSWFMYMSTGLLNEAGTVHPREFYPGDDFIDWVGQSLYVTDASAIAASLDAGYAAWAEVTNKPFFIPEAGLIDVGPNDGLAQFLAALESYDRVRAVTLSHFEAAQTVWGVSPIGARDGDWQALRDAVGYEEEMLDRTEIQFGSSPYSERWDGPGSGGVLATFTGTAGADVMVGTDGSDRLVGGAGGDTYIINSISDQVVETAGGGKDIAMSIVSFTLPEQVEDLVLTGTAAIDGYGNSLDNALTGNSAANMLYGGGGNDVIDGGAGADQMSGGLGNDTYFVDDAGDVVVEAAGSGQDRILISVSYTMPDHVETLGMQGFADLDATGNDSANDMLGNDGRNVLSGMGGDDNLSGAGGNDTLRGGDGLDFLLGGDGDDLLSGDAGADAMDGGAGNDRIVIEGGADNATGGAGFDTFVFRSMSATSIITDFEAGIDRLDVSQFGLGSIAEFQDAVVDQAGGVLLTIAGAGNLYLEAITVNDLLASQIDL